MNAAGTYYEIGLPPDRHNPSDTGSLDVAMQAHAYGGVPNEDGSYAWYVWAFRDGTIAMGNESEAQYLSHEYGSPLRNMEQSYVVRVQVTDTDGNICYGDSLAIHLGLGLSGAIPSVPPVIVIRDDSGIYSANYDALIGDLDDGTMGYWTRKEYEDDVVEEILQEWGWGTGTIVWYRGGPGDASEPQENTRTWTEAEIDNFLKVLDSGWPMLLVSQASGFNRGAFFPPSYQSGWEEWYGFTILDGQLKATQVRQMWAHGLTGGRGVAGSGDYGYLASEPFAMLTSGAIGGKGPTDGFDSDGSKAAEFYNGPGSSGEIPLELSFGEGYQLCALGYYSGLMLLDEYPVAAEGFCPGLNLSPAFENTYDLAFVSWGSTAAPNRNMDVFSQGEPWVNTADHGYARLWVIGYPWAQTQVVRSTSGHMQRSDMLWNIIGWLWEGRGYGYDPTYAGKPEIVQVMVGQWEDGGFHQESVSHTWDGEYGQYPDQTADAGFDVNAYRTTPPETGSYVVTSSPNNDWINGNDVDFQFPWYAYIEDVNGDGVQRGAGNNADDTVFFSGLLLDDPDGSWQRDLTLEPYTWIGQDDSVPSCVIDGFDPPVVVVGYYLATEPDTGDEVRSYYGAEAASVTIDNASEVTAECVAHWPAELTYGGFEYPAGSGQMLPVDEPVLYWSMYPGHNMLEPATGLTIPYGTPEGWDAYRRAFDVDPSVSMELRDLGDSWNRPRFIFHEASNRGRMVTFDYRQVPDWNPDLNRDGVIDNLDKFPVRVRLFTDHEDYATWTAGWPDHLQDPGLEPGEGRPVWDPSDSEYNIPDFLEGGAYIVDEGEPGYPFMLVDDPSQPDPHETVSGHTGNYRVTFSYVIVGGEPPYQAIFNLGYDQNYVEPGDPFYMTGYISDDYANHGSSGPNSYTALFDLPDGDHWAAAMATDNNGDHRVYMWPLSKVPCYPPD